MVPVLVAAGYRVVAPDFIGQTSKLRLAMGKAKQIVHFFLLQEVGTGTY